MPADGHAALRKDIANLKAGDGGARSGSRVHERGIARRDRALPSESSITPSHGAYLGALVDAMRDEYRQIVEAGLDLQLDCPDLALARHMLFTDLYG